MKLFSTTLFIGISISSFSQMKVKLTEVTDHIGDSVMVEGKVTDIKSLENVGSSATYITVGGANSKNSVTVVISGVDRYKFSVKPEEAYKNKSIRITGKVLSNNGKPEIVVHDPAQIVLVDKK